MDTESAAASPSGTLSTNITSAGSDSALTAVEAAAEARHLVMSNIVGAIVVVGCLAIAAALVFQLFAQLAQLNAEPATTARTTLSQSSFFALPPAEREAIAIFALEHDAQHLRTKRAQSLVGARLFIQAIGVLAGITLLVMGSSFVFARIKTPMNRLIGNDGKRSWTLESYSPGLVLAFFGCCLIGGSLYVSLVSQTLTEDAPVFLGRAKMQDSYQPDASALTPEQQAAEWKLIEQRREKLR